MRIVKNVFLFFFVMLNHSLSYGQKSCLDTATYDKFPRVANPVLSSNGQFLAFDVKVGPLHGSIMKRCIRSTATAWKLDLPIASDGVKFTGDSKFCLFKIQQDSLCIINLKNKSMFTIPKVLDYKLPEDAANSLITYTLKDLKNKFVIRDLSKKMINVFEGIRESWLSDNGEVVVLLKECGLAGAQKLELRCLELNTGKYQTIYVDHRAQNFIVDFKHRQVAYRVDNAVWYYKIGISMPITLIDIKRDQEAKFSLNDLSYFSNDGNRLFISIKEPTVTSNDLCDTSIEVWSFSDKKLQSEIAQGLPKEDTYKAVININEHKLIRLQRYNDEFLNKSYGTQDDFFLVSHRNGGGSFGEEEWNSASQQGFTLINAKSGYRDTLSWLDTPDRIDPKVSPNGRYITYYDSSIGEYFSYNIETRQTLKITNSTSTSWLRLGGVYPRGIAGWLPNDTALLVYDSNDLWRLDPAGKMNPVNLTKGYGVKRQIIFTVALEHQILLPNEELLLSGFNVSNKDNGFYLANLKESADPISLSSGPYVYATYSYNSLHYYGLRPLKAKNLGLYVVQRMSPSDAPNYFCTSDFKTFKRLTDLQPQAYYNWYTTELHNWVTKKGDNLQGILYKPENFDPNKKYPLIIHFYERLSDGLNAFLDPQYSYGELNIPSYVSNGYLVFCPDINYVLGNPMQGTFDAVQSAGEYLSNLPFVDRKKMGIQGHSFGGIQTNYLIAHTNIFAAACSSSGQSDYISAYGTLSADPGMGSMQNMYEQGQQRMGSTLWGNKQGYISNSSIINAEKVTTPLLMKHGRQDPVCSFSNAMEFFLGLRRLGKTVWLIAYPNAAHNLYGADAIDFTIRMKQFFDYYLKDMAAPLWMLSNMNNSRNCTSLELDTTNRKPGPNLLTPKAQQEVDSLSRKSFSLNIN